MTYLLIYCRCWRYFLEKETGRELLITFLFFWGITLRKIYSEDSNHIMKEKYKPENVALRDFRVVKVLRSVSLRITKLFYGTEPKGLLPTMCYCAQTHLNPFFSLLDQEWAGKVQQKGITGRQTLSNRLLTCFYSVRLIRAMSRQLLLASTSRTCVRNTPQEMCSELFGRRNTC